MSYLMSSYLNVTISDIVIIIITSAKEVMFLPEFVCLSVCQQDNSKSYGRIFLKFSGYVGNGKNYW